jgi:hypothetical protein
MKKVHIDKIKIEPIFKSISREKISDEEYFSKKYSGYISNSRLKLINPQQKGSPSMYKQGFSGDSTTSLALGSAVHELFLQPELFSLGPDYSKPGGKLGMVADEYIKNRGKQSIREGIIKACKKIGYYKDNLTDNRIKSIIKECLPYYWKRVHGEHNDSEIFLSSKDRDIVERCVNNLQSNKLIQNLIAPVDFFGDRIDSYNEDAFFIDFKCSHDDKDCVIKFKMKADNWTIDVENKIITLNDLKTTSSFACKFMEKSWVNYHYSRQFASYLYVLLRYCEKEYGYNPEEWTFKCNVIVVETTADNRAVVFPITRDMLEPGRHEFCRLLKMVAYCEMYDYSDDIEFL